ncbi:MAG: YibE/F family protein [Defluviitaleaceae bacterium]|nr:YibE/F family protein [Defluviitaleaceae bacterium]MCL2239043.1 YibE/F family protein [Defluviitaleaceae bacterium]
MQRNDWLIYAGTLLVSVLFLFIGNRIAARETMEEDFFDHVTYYSARVTQIISREEVASGWGWDEDMLSTYITFDARITRGERRGEEIRAEQLLSEFFTVNEREVTAGSRILLVYDEMDTSYHFAGFLRFNFVIVFGVVFLALVIVFGRKKGLNAIVALGFTCLAVFLVFIPAILSGRNIYITTLIICVYAIVSTLLIVIGANKKALSAMLGCLGGVLTAGLLMFLMDRIMHLTGALDQETMSLLFLPIENPIDLRALIFAGVILGAVGAIMDVAMSIASSLWEVREAGGVADFKGITRSGINIGKDILGTMLNTLILAYIGSSMTLILLIVAYTHSFTALFNMEMIIVEFLRALVGSFGMLATIPLTAGICGWLYSRAEERNEWDDYFNRSSSR